MPNPISKQALIEKLKAFAEKNGRAPTQAEFGHHTPVRRHFGNYSAFILSQGLTPIGYVEGNLSKEQLKEKLKAFIETHNRTPKRTEFRYLGSVKREYGTFLAFIKAAGYSSVHIRSQSTLSARNRMAALLGESISKELLIEELWAFVNEHGRTPACEELGYGYQPANKYFGSYKAFIRGQGLTPAKNGRKPISKEALVDKLKTFVFIHDHAPKISEFGYPERIKELYGTFDAFIRENGYEPTPNKSREKPSLIGERFGRLVVVSKGPRGQYNQTSWNCLCDCGNTKNNVSRSCLISGTVKSCGCLQKELLHLKKYQVDNTFLAGLSDKPTRMNKTGVRGVTIKKGAIKNKYQANIGIKGKTIYLGSFDTLEEAAAARKAAEEKYFAPILEKYNDRLKKD